MQIDLNTTKKSLKNLNLSHNFVTVAFTLIVLLSIQAMIESHLDKSSANVRRMNIARSITR
jgi:hypothetical protein